MPHDTPDRRDRLRHLMVVLLTGPRQRRTRLVILVTAILALVIGLKTDLHTGSGSAPVRPLIYDGQRFRDPTGHERELGLGSRLPPGPPFWLQTQLEFSYRCVTVFGVVLDSEIDLVVRIASQRAGDATSIRNAPGVQELAAAELEDTLQHMRFRPPLGPHRGVELPESLSVIAPGSPPTPDSPIRWGWGHATLAVATGAAGTLGPWYAIAVAMQLAALPVLVICTLWFIFRRMVGGYLDRTFARAAAGQCPDCRYDLSSGGLTACPECGKDSTATLAEAAEIASAINHQPEPWFATLGRPPS